MNIIEAIKSGKRFKRPSMDGYWSYDSERQAFRDDINDTIWLDDSVEAWDSVFHCEDWELEKEKIEITESSFREAYHKALLEYENQRVLRSNYASKDTHEVIRYLAKHLGVPI